MSLTYAVLTINYKIIILEAGEMLRGTVIQAEMIQAGPGCDVVWVSEEKRTISRHHLKLRPAGFPAVCIWSEKKRGESGSKPK